MEELIAKLENDGVLRSPAILQALRVIDRRDFVPPELRASAYLDHPLPIGAGQTISQPYTVVFMLELLAPESGEKIMDIGAGSGWQTALLAEIVGSAGAVYAVERIPALCRFAQENLQKYPRLTPRINFFCQNASAGLPALAEKLGGFDAIVAAASLAAAPSGWVSQLKPGGRLVYPFSHSLFRSVKNQAGELTSEEYQGFIFVPFIGSE